jgi:lysophospholipase L1-like esterase
LEVLARWRDKTSAFDALTMQRCFGLTEALPMTYCRMLAIGPTVVIAMTLSACGPIGQVTPTNDVASSSVTYNYTAFGASDAVGVGASVMCDPNGLVANPTCPGGTGYVPDIARILSQPPGHVNLNDLGISGAVVGPNVQSLLYSCAAFKNANPGLNNFVTNELPLYPSGENLITIFAGGNDVRDLFVANAVFGCGLNPTTYFGAFAVDFGTLLQTVHFKAPLAHIVVADLPNLGLIPLGVCLGSSPSSPPPFCGSSDPPGNSPLAQAALGQLSEALDVNIYQAIEAQTLVPMVDLLCDNRSYDPTNFSPDGFHPDDAGYLILAQKYIALFQTTTPPPPSFTCSQATQFSLHTHPLWSKMRGVKIPKY